MAARWMKTRQTKYAAYTFVYIVVVLAILVVVNFLANRYDRSYDSTANKQYSLSDQTVKLVRGLQNDVTISYFDEETRFPQARDLLDRYSSLSPRLKVEYINPLKRPQQAKAAGYRRDANIIVASGPKKEEAKSLTEEEVTGALVRAVKGGNRNVCFLNVAGEHSLDDTGGNGYANLKTILERDNYQSRAVDLKSGAPEKGALKVGQAETGNIAVPSDCAALVIGGPQGDYPAPVVNAIKSFVDGGGHALVMLDTPVNLGSEQPGAENAELVKALSEWGVTANKDVALDLSGLGRIFRLGPEVPLVASYESHPITRPLSGGIPTAFPLTRTLDTASAGKATATKLFGTTADSVAVTSIPKTGEFDPSKGKKGPLTLGAAVTFSGNQARLVVTGTSLWTTNSLIASRQVGNRDLFMNMINWLTSDEELISIRPKPPEERPLNLSTAKVDMLFWLSVVIFPLAVVGFGMATWWKRR